MNNAAMETYLRTADLDGVCYIGKFGPFTLRFFSHQSAINRMLLNSADWLFKSRTPIMPMSMGVVLNGVAVERWCSEQDQLVELGFIVIKGKGQDVISSRYFSLKQFLDGDQGLCDIERAEQAIRYGVPGA